MGFLATSLRLSATIRSIPFTLDQLIRFLAFTINQNNLAT
jgi:hypothetical protein